MSPYDYLISLGLIIFLYVSLSPLSHLVHLLAPSPIYPFVAPSSLFVIDLGKREKAATSPGCLLGPQSSPGPAWGASRNPSTSGLFALLMSLETKGHRHTHPPTALHDTPRLGMEICALPMASLGYFSSPLKTQFHCASSLESSRFPQQKGAHTPLSSTALYVCSGKSYNLAL